ncbi:hypothetical protein BKA62DRAFT_706389 [Auriculariales sp. MPI-PUGE-AT-0066]|nr:hypothetical protein BKA62DRAFT_706389 [Auriculariales sp. MPI-PUGE-AT-0066]
MHGSHKDQHLRASSSFPSLFPRSNISSHITAPARLPSDLGLSDHSQLCTMNQCTLPQEDALPQSEAASSNGPPPSLFTRPDGGIQLPPLKFGAGQLTVLAMESSYQTLPSISFELGSYGRPNPLSRSLSAPQTLGNYAITRNTSKSPAIQKNNLGGSLEGHVSCSVRPRIAATVPGFRDASWQHREPASPISSSSFDELSYSASEHSSHAASPLLAGEKRLEGFDRHAHSGSRSRRVAPASSTTTSRLPPSATVETKTIYRKMPKSNRKGPGKEKLARDKPFGCEHCAHRFETAERRDEHQENHRYVCNICGKRYTGADVLRTHKERHSDERKYICDINGCGKSFNTRGDVYQHQRQTHGMARDTSR